MPTHTMLVTLLALLAVGACGSSGAGARIGFLDGGGEPADTAAPADAFAAAARPDTGGGADGAGGKSDALPADDGDRTDGRGDVGEDAGGPGADAGCRGNGDCDDGDACDGVERCVDGGCVGGAPLVCGAGERCDGAAGCVPAAGPPSPVVDTDQTRCYDAGACAPCPGPGDAFAGQDAAFRHIAPAYEVVGEVVVDRNTGLTWQRTPTRRTFAEAQAAAAACRTGGYDDWRLPTIDELYSLILFSGYDPSACDTAAACPLVPFLAPEFAFAWGDPAAGERVIDAQYASSTAYVGRVMDGERAIFGVNFADGRIKGYPWGPTPDHPDGKEFFVRLVRGPSGYGESHFSDPEDGTIRDTATGLTWMRVDSGGLGAGPRGDGTMDWPTALAWCDGLVHAGLDDWRLPDVKELQGIVDYARSPSTTASAAIDPLFEATPIVDEGGGANWGCYWSSTTHAAIGPNGGALGEAAAYVAFGEALGWMPDPVTGAYRLLDVHGAGAQRSDPKVGDAADYPRGRGPQGDVVRIDNLVRCVRGGEVAAASGGGSCAGVPLAPDCGAVGAGQPCCGDGACDPLETTERCPADCGASPAACVSDADCQAPDVCPPDAVRGCVCATTPFGEACVPVCETDADCPDPPHETLVCDPAGQCVPEDGPP